MQEQGYGEDASLHAHGMTSVLVWWENLWLKSAISAEASGRLWTAQPGGQLGELWAMNFENFLSPIAHCLCTYKAKKS
jgi:hypothetical protein